MKVKKEMKPKTKQKLMKIYKVFLIIITLAVTGYMAYDVYKISVLTLSFIIATGGIMCSGLIKFMFDLYEIVENEAQN